MNGTTRRIMKPDEFPSPFDKMFANLLEDGQMLYESLRTKMVSPFCKRSLTIQIVDDMKLNAGVFCKNNNYFLRFNRGALQHILGATFGLCCCPAFLPTIGKPDEVAPNLIEPGFPPIPLMDQDDGSNILIPQDQVRANIAHLLADIAIHFMIGHEIGHIVGGHIEALNAISNTTWTISEYRNTGNQNKKDPLRHAMECDADSFASHFLWWVHTGKPSSIELRKLMQTNMHSPEDCAFITLLTAVSILFRTLYPTAPITIGAAQETHPHPAVRDFVVGCCVLTRGQAHNKLSAAKLDDLLCNSVINVEQVWTNYCLHERTVVSSAVWVQDVMREAKNLSAIYSKYKNLFEKHAHLPRIWHDWEWL